MISKMKSKLAVLFFLAFTGILSPSVFAEAGKDQMGFTVIEDASGRHVMVLWGAITEDDVPRFRNTAKANPAIRGFWLASNGGDPMAAMDIGRMIRRTGLPVTVPSKERLFSAAQKTLASGSRTSIEAAKLVAWLDPRPKVICASACGYLLIGGKVRFVDQQHTVGLHASSRPDSVLVSMITGYEDPNAVYRDLDRDMQNSVALKNSYIAEMSVSAGYSKISTAVPSKCMYYLSGTEMTALNLTNVNGFQTPGESIGKCECWEYPKGHPKWREFNRICAKSASSGIAELSSWRPVRTK